MITLYHAYRFGNRKPVIVTSYTAGLGELTVTGFNSREKFEDYLKFYTFESNEPFRTIAEIEHTHRPRETVLFFKTIPHVVEVTL